MENPKYYFRYYVKSIFLSLFRFSCFSCAFGLISLNTKFV